MHPLINTVQFIWWAQPLEERGLIWRQRQNALHTFEIHRATLAADPAATAEDLEVVDAYIRFAEHKLGILAPEEEERRIERRRQKTRERVRRHRERGKRKRELLESVAVNRPK
jgi:hypothetical protein